jgi:hypothetical protein
MIKRKCTLGTSGPEWVFLALMALGLGFGLPGSRGGDVFFERFEDACLVVLEDAIPPRLDGGMHTAVLEFVDGAWVVVARTHQGMAGVDEAREAEARASARVRVRAVPWGGLLWRTGFLLAGPDAGSVGFEQCTVGEGFCRRMGHGSVGGRGYRT